MGKFTLNRKEFRVGSVGIDRKIHIEEKNGRKFGKLEWNYSMGRRGSGWRSLAKEISTFLPGSNLDSQKASNESQNSKDSIRKEKEGSLVLVVKVKGSGMDGRQSYTRNF
ncbi:hypothetical protein E5676_scaffold120G001110 [Cucumis melo var. makuwa]|uniref:Uncharacterized protein n=1 Tax=Cucumis melo var. makuwa TaxID=1194695 RepID=A0A5D3E0A1_CUCMM|nr:hypothetical protein E5676_scaffold120G001110 [Cucumis melo var. makuwa]